MADKKAESKEAKPSEDGKPAKGGIVGLLTKLPVLIGGVMVLEAVALFVVFKMMSGGPAAADAHGVDPHGIEDPHADAEAEGLYSANLVEVPVDSFRAYNNTSGTTYLYDVDISIQVKPDVKEKVEAKLAASTALVRDRMNQIIRSIDPQKLNGSAEPGLETLRRQVKYQLDLIIGDGLIEEVLVPRCLPYRANY
jgi:flagellar basal body-associated protein FliL